jgi:hypothetical protein
MDDVALAVLKALAEAIPSFASWIGGLLDSEPEPSAFSRRVRDILPAKSESRQAAEDLAR